MLFQATKSAAIRYAAINSAYLKIRCHSKRHFFQSFFSTQDPPSMLDMSLSAGGRTAQQDFLIPLRCCSAEGHTEPFCARHCSRLTKRLRICPKSQKAGCKSQDSTQATCLQSPHLSCHTAHPFLPQCLQRGGRCDDTESWVQGNSWTEVGPSPTGRTRMT